jgi:hypothetical protein
VLKIKVNIKIKHFIISKKKLRQNIGIFSFNDYFLQDTFLFYRSLRTFTQKFYLPYKVLYVSEGINQYYIDYDVSEVINPEYSDVDTFFSFGIPDKEERICHSCEYYGKEYCKYHDKEIKEIPKYCFFWSQK